MEGLPAAPGSSDEYDLPYRVLIGYLITTSHNDKVSETSPAPILLSRWADGWRPDAARMHLAPRQFAFYARDLKNGNPYSSNADEGAVERTRNYLSQFSGIERVYQFRLASVGKKTMNDNREVPGSAQAVINSRDILGAFTQAGSDFMQDALKRADQFFEGEECVLGRVRRDNSDKTKLTQEPSAHFFSYDGLWSAFRLKGETELGTSGRRTQPRMGGKTVTLPSRAPLRVGFLLDTGGLSPFFCKGSMSGLKCVLTVAR